MCRINDQIVIGAGMAGVNAARKCASNGWDVAIVNALPYGGTCALRGCDPKKMLRRGAEIIDAARLMTGKGIDPGDLRIDWPDLMAQKRSFTGAVQDKMETGLEKADVETLRSKVRFVHDTTLEFDGGQRAEARRFFIATVAKPRPLDIPSARPSLSRNWCASGCLKRRRRNRDTTSWSTGPMPAAGTPRSGSARPTRLQSSSMRLAGIGSGFAALIGDTGR